MLKPYWRSIGPTAVKDLQTRPQTTQSVADLLGLSVSDLLLRIQAEVLPWLMLTKKKDVILRIAQARKDSEPAMTCYNGTNLAPIMALLLVQPVKDQESFILPLFREIWPSFFAKMELVDLLKTEPMLIALELLKDAGDIDENRRSRVCEDA